MQQKAPQNAFKVMDYLFTNQDQFTEEALMNKPANVFYDELSQIVAEVGVSGWRLRLSMQVA